jgi:hypothetical protein
VNDPIRFSTTVEESLIRAAHACLVTHVHKLEQYYQTRAIPDDPLEIPTLGVVIVTRLDHARRLQASIAGLLSCCHDGNDSHHAERDHLEKVLASTTTLLDHMESLATRSQTLVADLATHRQAVKGCYHAY